MKWISYQCLTWPDDLTPNACVFRDLLVDDAADGHVYRKHDTFSHCVGMKDNNCFYCLLQKCRNYFLLECAATGYNILAFYVFSRSNTIS